MDPDGILKGSIMNERSTNTAQITGKNPAVYSNQSGIRAIPARSRWGAKYSLSAIQAIPETITKIKRISAKFINPLPVKLPRRLLVESPHYPLASYASYLLFVSLITYAYVIYRRHNI